MRFLSSLNQSLFNLRSTAHLASHHLHCPLFPIYILPLGILAPLPSLPRGKLCLKASNDTWCKSMATCLVDPCIYRYITGHICKLHTGLKVLSVVYSTSLAIRPYICTSMLPPKSLSCSDESMAYGCTNWHCLQQNNVVRKAKMAKPCTPTEKNVMGKLVLVYHMQTCCKNYK